MLTLRRAAMRTVADWGDQRLVPNGLSDAAQSSAHAFESKTPCAARIFTIKVKIEMSGCRHISGCNTHCPANLPITLLITKTHILFLP